MSSGFLLHWFGNVLIGYLVGRWTILLPFALSVAIAIGAGALFNIVVMIVRVRYRWYGR